MDLQAICTDHPVLPGHWLLYLSLSTESSPATGRASVHLALALDVSSSMGGPRLACAITAARSLVSKLGPEDLFALLTFDQSVRVVFGPGKVTPGARALLHAALGTVRPGVGTALHAALTRSYALLHRVFARQARPHAVMLTDGHPSVGPRDPAVFAAASREAAAGAIITSAVGVGLDFDEHCLAALAEGGGGRYSFVEDEADIPGALALHLSDLFAIGLPNATVRLTPAPAVQEARLLHRYTARVDREGFTVETGPVGASCPRRLLFELSARGPLGPAAAEVTVTAENGAPLRLTVPVASAGPLVREARAEYRRLSLAARESELWAALHAGGEGAAEALARAQVELAELEAAGAPAAEVAAGNARLADARAVLEGRLARRAREAARKRSHQSQVARLTSMGLASAWGSSPGRRQAASTSSPGTE